MQRIAPLNGSSDIRCHFLLIQRFDGSAVEHAMSNMSLCAPLYMNHWWWLLLLCELNLKLVSIKLNIFRAIQNLNLFEKKVSLKMIYLHKSTLLKAYCYNYLFLTSISLECNRWLFKFHSNTMLIVWILDTLVWNRFGYFDPLNWSWEQLLHSSEALRKEYWCYDFKFRVDNFYFTFIHWVRRR